MYTMSEEHQAIINGKSKDLKTSIHTKIDDVCDFLLEKGIISQSMRENILYKGERTRIEKSLALLKLIVDRGTRAFKALYEACKQSGLKDAADILEPDKGPHQILKATGAAVAFKHEEQRLPVEWPNREHFERVKGKRLVVKTVTKQSYPEMWDMYQTHESKQTFIYPMLHVRRGNALIINIDKFEESPLTTREGSEWDTQGLEQLFTGLGFEVKSGDSYKNLSKDKIDDLIEKEMKEDHKLHDCFVFYIMSHGKEGMVFDKNGVPMKIQSFIDRFDLVKDLKEKPKLFFFQACRDRTEQSQESGAVSNPAEVEHDTELETEGGAYAIGYTRGKADNRSISRPDVFVFRSSTEGSKAVRDNGWGSWFTQAIIYVFSEYAYCCRLSELQLKVNALVSKAETEGQKNVAEYSSAPTNQLFFFPGLHKK